MVPRLEKETENFNSNGKALIEKCKWRYIVIKDQKVIGDYDSPPDPVKDAMKTRKPSAFLVQTCEPVILLQRQNPAPTLNILAPSRN